ncbi:OmpA family protein [Bradyrhizobium elkanii]|uniref:OmpA family protein n=1 Tax=Bradyrhizobium elkanii TaxID=29448 RepID=UPI001AEB9CC2|nr:OmpA family protein [Bradyrhizobium elkanii]MBP2434092.1 outer membrane protein OmpA-like peptidoglycan-associated protein [Bradyrhizobium elkanii]WLA88981.1 OmpA family protein [Bradyrhizobium elkanii]
MSNLQTPNRFRSLYWLQIASIALASSAVSAADRVTEDQIIQALTAKKELARSITTNPRVDPSVQASFVERIRGLERVLTPDEREQVAVITEDKPQIDLEITFDYNSAEINSKALPSVQTLGRALGSPDLKGATFVVAGHTDAAGLEAYNQDLSQRRADSIKRYLIQNFGVPGEDLVTVGYGKTKLKDPGHPFAEVNRRVQVSNISSANYSTK